MSKIISFGEALALYEQGTPEQKRELEKYSIVVSEHRKPSSLGYYIPWYREDAKGSSDYDVLRLLYDDFSFDYEADKYEVLCSIVHSIMNRFPNVCLSSNHTKDEVFIADDIDFGYWIEQVADFFHFEILPFCGCGCLEDTTNAFLRVMNRMKIMSNVDGKDFSRVYDEQEKELSDLGEAFIQTIQYVLNDCALASHGSSIGGSSLTSFGKAYYFVLSNIDLS